MVDYKSLDDEECYILLHPQFRQHNVIKTQSVQTQLKMKARHLKENIKASKLQKLIQYEQDHGYTEQYQEEQTNELHRKFK